ncbi:MAG: substrate-binding domain-containing protein [Bacteroidetes bacterium]|nr:substrate-binding domain-containing protein [Bacteroidota bacterium]MDA1176139.1 substrate-binding domain-containing protein [Bacteroidota bacterium]
MKTVRVGGVPEHFNYAWYIGLKNNLFKENGINLRWVDCPGGTGEMTQALRTNSIDMAVVLTEGIVKAITEGLSSKIVQTYVQSPLVWGVHVAYNSKFKTSSELKNKKAAISRYGSGSHLMAYINAQQLEWDVTRDLEFKLIKNLDGGVKALSNGDADYFLWEKFTTKPFVDEGIFKRIGECPTPWPCFVIAARDELINSDSSSLKTILEMINTMTKKFKTIPEIDQIISKRYKQKQTDVQQWLSQTEWSQKNIDKKTIEIVQNKLMALDLLSKKLSYNELTHSI